MSARFLAFTVHRADGSSRVLFYERDDADGRRAVEAAAFAELVRRDVERISVSPTDRVAQGARIGGAR